MAITFDWVVLPHLKKKNGTNFIRIRVTHKRKSKYIKTNVAVEPDDLTRSGNLKHEGKRRLAQKEVERLQDIASGMPSYSAEALDVDEVVRYITAKLAEQEVFRLDFIAYGLSLADKKKEATGGQYRAALSCLARYYKRNPDISEVTLRALKEFEAHVKDEGKTERTAAFYIGVIRAVYKAARKEFNDPDLGVMRIPVDIFEYYEPIKPKPTEPRPIPKEWVQMMIDQRKELEGRERLAVDAFLISFALMGMNLADMYHSKEEVKDGVIHYYRRKTTDKRRDRAEMYVRVESCVRELLEPYLGKGRLFCFVKLYGTKQGLISAVNDGLKAWASRNGLEEFTSYAARHTWGTLAASKQVGVDLALVTEGLCHSDSSRRMDMVYIRKDWERVWDANAKVLALFRWQ